VSFSILYSMVFYRDKIFLRREDKQNRLLNEDGELLIVVSHSKTIIFDPRNCLSAKTLST